jgi:NDP-sugar pyrophosphorylase family protein
MKTLSSSDSVTAAFFLAAGFGSRLKPYTLEYPKPCIPFLGLPLLFHSVDFLSHYTKQRIETSWVNLHHLGPTLKKFIEENQQWLPLDQIIFSEEQSSILDSGGALAYCESQLKNQESFWVLNSDEVLLPKTPQFSLEPLITQHRKTKALATLLVTDHDQVGIALGGVWAGSSGEVVTFSKVPQEGLKGWHYVGVLLLSSRIFQYTSQPVQAENILYDVLTRGIKAGESVYIHEAALHWIETGILSQFLSNEIQWKKEIQEETFLGQQMRERLSRYPAFESLIQP